MHSVGETKVSILRNPESRLFYSTVSLKKVKRDKNLSELNMLESSDTDRAFIRRTRQDSRFLKNRRKSSFGSRWLHPFCQCCTTVWRERDQRNTRRNGCSDSAVKSSPETRCFARRLRVARVCLAKSKINFVHRFASTRWDCKLHCFRDEFFFFRTFDGLERKNIEEISVGFITL